MEVNRDHVARPERFSKTFGPNVLFPIDFHKVRLTVNKELVVLLAATVRLASYYVQALLSTATPVAVLITHHLSKTLPVLAIWR